MVSPLLDVEAETKVAALVERYLEKHQPGGYRLVVTHSAIRRSPGGRWLVQIRPEPASAAADDFVDRLLAAGEDIEKDFPRYVFLTQIVPQPGEVL